MKGKVHITCFEKCNLQPVQTRETSSVAWLLTCTSLDYSPLCQLEGTWKQKTIQFVSTKIHFGSIQLWHLIYSKIYI
jgi:hypothetical protein